MTAERRLEAKLCVEAKKRGLLAIKLTSPNLAGVPDRLILCPDGKCVFVELKAEGKTMRPLQVHIARKIQALGHTVLTIDTDAKLSALMDALEGGVIP